jgi:hypothetical protein
VRLLCLVVGLFRRLAFLADSAHIVPFAGSTGVLFGIPGRNDVFTSI